MLRFAERPEDAQNSAAGARRSALPAMANRADNEARQRKQAELAPTAIPTLKTGRIARRYSTADSLSLRLKMRIAGNVVYQTLEIANKFESSLNSQRRGNRQSNPAAAVPTDAIGDATKQGSAAVRPKNLVPVVTLPGQTGFLPKGASGLIDEIV
jgi:hypothetical protein